jgi:diacylglycerol kinase (ATP)
MRALLIHSSTAGDHGTSAEDIALLLKEAGYEVEVRSPKDEDCARMVQQGADLVVAAGGDGTVTKVVLAAPSRATVGILPLGTANNIANSLGIAGKPGDIISRWSPDSHKTIDIWLAQGPWGERLFIEGCGLGALTRTAHHMDDHEITGHSPDHEISIAREALKKVLSHSQPVSAKLTIDDRTLAGRFLMLEMLNFGAVGPRLPLAWSADPSDGLLEVGYVLEEDYNDFCEWLSNGASPLSAAPVTLHRARMVGVTWQNARFRIGDDYWPDTGMPEPRATHEAAIRFARPGPKILIPRAEKPIRHGPEPAPRPAV